MKENPSILTLLCHGHGNMLNPFKSFLELENSSMSVLDVLKAEADLSGSKILLGACESDLAPPLDHVVDEHLSLSTAFLSHGPEVVAGLWKVTPKLLDECYVSLIDEENWHEALREWQRNKIELWNKRRRKNADLFYYSVPFRIVGWPYPIAPSFLKRFREWFQPLESLRKFFGTRKAGGPSNHATRFRRKGGGF